MKPLQISDNDCIVKPDTFFSLVASIETSLKKLLIEIDTEVGIGMLQLPQLRNALIQVLKKTY